MTFVFFGYLKDLLLQLVSDWWTQILAAIVGAFVIWFLGLLPPRYQFQKRLNFSLKVKNVVGKLEISVETDEYIAIKDIRNKLKTFFDKKRITDPNLQNNYTFKSNNTGTSYELSSTRDEGINKNFVNIKCFNAVKIGIFGGIKSIDSFTDELQELLDNFNFRKDKDKISIFINVTPRWKFFKEDKTSINYS